MLAKDPSTNVALRIHISIHVTITRNLKYGIYMMAIAKLVRMAGRDQLHLETLTKWKKTL